MFLVCEICREPIAIFDPQKLTYPINLSIFTSLYPERAVPDPFPPALGDNWQAAACPRCRKRPFFNHLDRGDGTFTISTGEIVPGDERWFVLTFGDSGSIEKMLCCPVIPQKDPPEPPSQQPDEELELADSPDQQAQQPEPGKASPGSYKAPPVSCPHCGQQFRSAGRMAKFHPVCPKAKPPQEGFKL